MYYYIKKNLNASKKSSEHPPNQGNKMPKRLSRNFSCSKDKSSSWHSFGFPDGSIKNRIIESTA